MLWIVEKFYRRPLVKGNAGRCSKKSSKATYAKKRKCHGKREKNVDVSIKKSSVLVSLQKIKKVKKVPNKKSSKCTRIYSSRYANIAGYYF